MLTSKKTILRGATLIFAVLLSVSLLAPVAQARASAYIFSYAISVCPDGNGKVSAWFDVSGTGTMEELGTKTITIYENGTAVKSFSYLSTPSMMAYNTAFHYGSVSYDGVKGKSYYAIATFWAAKQGGGDSRTKQSATIVAT